MRLEARRRDVAFMGMVKGVRHALIRQKRFKRKKEIYDIS